MPVFERKTRKLYYEAPTLARCEARIVRVGADYLELDATVAYPEGGGQEADHGEIVLPDGRCLHFAHARKMYGTRALIPEFPDILVDGVIEHIVCANDLPLLDDLCKGMRVEVRIDTQRRAQLSLSHTISHLVYLGVAQVRPDAIASIIGCHIRPAAARFDFAVAERFSIDEVKAIEQIANGYAARGSAVHVYAHEQHPDARYWECEGQRIPCGGTHPGSTESIGAFQVRRKSMGRDKERISCTFPRACAVWGDVPVPVY